MPGIELIRSFLQQANAQGSRSTALNPLGWALTIILSALLGSIWAKAPSWVPITLACFAGGILVLYLTAYTYFMIRSPDALRSEKFTLSKLAIERSVTGDNITGFIASGDLNGLTALPSHPESDHE